MYMANASGGSIKALAAAVLLIPAIAAAQDRDTQEVQAYVLTDAGLAKYTQATKKLAALSDGSSACEDDDGDDSQSLDAMTAKLNAQPGAKAAIASAGMTTREYVVFSWSLMQNGLAAWAVSQPGGKLPAGVSKANVDFYRKNEAALQQLQGAGGEADCDDNRDEEENEE